MRLRWYTVEDLLMVWWIWVAAGLGLLVFELAAPGGFVLFFLGIAGILTGGAVVIGILESFTAQILCFSILALVLFVAFRDKAVALISRPNGHTDSDRIIGQTGVVTAEISGAERGQIELRGATWSARAVESKASMPVGARVRVVQLDGLVVIVEPDSSAS